MILVLNPKYLRQGKGQCFYQAIEAFIKQQDKGRALQVEILEPKGQNFFRTLGFCSNAVNQSLTKDL